MVVDLTMVADIAIQIISIVEVLGRFTLVVQSIVAALQ